jgi:hypothetical protein
VEANAIRALIGRWNASFMDVSLRVLRSGIEDLAAYGS